jgi:hypothetical protein
MSEAEAVIFVVVITGAVIVLALFATRRAGAWRRPWRSVQYDVPGVRITWFERGWDARPSPSFRRDPAGKILDEAAASDGKPLSAGGADHRPPGLPKGVGLYFTCFEIKHFGLAWIEPVWTVRRAAAPLDSRRQVLVVGERDARGNNRYRVVAEIDDLDAGNALFSVAGEGSVKRGKVPARDDFQASAPGGNLPPEAEDAGHRGQHGGNKGDDGAIHARHSTPAEGAGQDQTGEGVAI